MSRIEHIPLKLADICENGIQRYINDDRFDEMFKKNEIIKAHPGGKETCLIYSKDRVIKQEQVYTKPKSQAGNVDIRSLRLEPAPDTLTYYQIVKLQPKLETILKIYDVVYSYHKFLHNPNNEYGKPDTTNILNLLVFDDDYKLKKNEAINTDDTSSIYEYKTLEYADKGDLMGNLLLTLISGKLLKIKNPKTGETEKVNFTTANKNTLDLISQKISGLFIEFLMYMFVITYTYKIILHFVPNFVHGDMKCNNIFLKSAPEKTERFILDMQNINNKVITFDSKLINNNIPKFADYGNTPNTQFLNHCYKTRGTEVQTPDTDVYNMMITNLLEYNDIDDRMTVALTPELKKVVADIKAIPIAGFLDNLNSYLEAKLLELGLITLKPSNGSVKGDNSFFLYSNHRDLNEVNNSSIRPLKPSMKTSMKPSMKQPGRIARHNSFTFRRGSNKKTTRSHSFRGTKKMSRRTSSSNFGHGNIFSLRKEASI